MTTDTRRIAQLVRQEYFRRVLCDFYGGMMADGAVPHDFEFIGGIIQDICYRNACKFFNREDLLVHAR